MDTNNIFHSGFVFDYNNAKLNHSQLISPEEMAVINDTKHNNDDIPLYVRCLKCGGEYMDFEVDPNDDLDGYWVCPSCKKKVREKTAYLKLDKENRESKF
ncbi:hypothetical protein EI53_01517 [Fusobacterium naviforme]|nr:hypothetical protein F7P78_08440 [Fusobacterium naviforme]PSL09759.1 hypothetical protein EI53_01517 [Fusobacterium naviforme]STO26769.1 Uncharacterised protein [Fusobacterium naviforme]